ncbi:MAG: HEPN domain-containing protein [Thermodesulfobacteriota bacterium]|nr:HEPN domain-containing protein [Thermodesulfobacteriota bacterium]
MPQDRPVPGSAEDWLARAEGDLALARALLPEGAFYEDLCFHAQQAAEKAIKAIYQHCGKRFRYTHDLDELITGLKNEGISVPGEVMEAALLTSYAWEARYPGLSEPVTVEEYREALRQAELVVSWAVKVIKESL